MRLPLESVNTVWAGRRAVNKHKAFGPSTGLFQCFWSLQCQPPCAWPRFQAWLHISYCLPQTAGESCLDCSAAFPVSTVWFCSLKREGQLHPKNLPRDLKKIINMEKLHILKPIPFTFEVLQSIAAAPLQSSSPSYCLLQPPRHSCSNCWSR